VILRHLRAPDARRFVGASLAVGAAFVVFGLSFGVLAVTAGASVLQATVM
jgi:predicted branched-subunit amino acid permease